MLIPLVLGVLIAQSSSKPSLFPNPFAQLPLDTFRGRAADFNGDGRVDYLSDGGFNHQGWSVSFRDADGRVRSSNVYPELAHWIQDVAILDLDGDLDLDLVITTTPRMYSFLNDGTGAFTGGQQWATNDALSFIVGADFDGDGDGDIARFDATHLRLYRSRGDGTFDAPVDASPGSAAYVCEAAPDIDSDGDLDIVSLAANPYRIEVRANDGTGVFSLISSTPTIATIRPVLLDVNRDGHLDSIVASQTALYAHFGHGDGTFDAAVWIGDAYLPQTLESADLENDGVPEIIVLPGHSSPAPMMMYRASYDGVLSGGIELPLGHYFFGAQDIDGDSFGELTIGGGDWIVDHSHRGDGVLVRSKTSPFVSGSDTSESVDLDGDGDLDLVAAPTFSDGQIRLALNDGSGNFTTHARAVNVSGLKSMQVVDFNGDGAFELVLSQNGTIEVRDGGPGLTFGPARVLGAVQGLARVYDIDRDGDLDVSGVDGPSLQLRTFMNIGQGNFIGPFLANAQVSDPRDLRFGDLDGDGDTDAIVMGIHLPPNSPCRIGVLQGIGGVGFLLAQPTTIQLHTIAMDLFDVDGDSDLDLVTHHGSATSTSNFAGGFDVRLNLGGLTFGAPISQTADLSYRDRHVADFDGDGHLDFLVSGGLPYGNGLIGLMYGDGDGTFGTARDMHLMDEPSITSEFGDFDGDGDLDIAGIGSGPGKIETFASLVLQPPATYCAGNSDSAGCTPNISTSGTPSSTSAAPFFVDTTDVLSNKFGFLLYSLEATNQPFHGKRICIGAPRRRTPQQNSSGTPNVADCSGAFSFDFNGRIQSGNDPALVAGREVFAQYWYRDPQAVIGKSALSDAVRFTIQ